MEHKIVISDCDHNDIRMETEVLAGEGLSCDRRKCLSEDEVIAGCADATVLLVQFARIGAKVIAALPGLKQVVRYGVGYDNVDIQAAREAGVTVCNVPDYGMAEVADHAMAMSLCLLRKLRVADAAVRRGSWTYSHTVPIRRIGTLTAGIVGFGRIGREYAKRMHAFGARILVTGRRVPETPEYARAVGLEELLRESDVISLHCPSGGNIGMIGPAEFALMKEGTVIVNTARGGIVDEAALDKALSSGKLAGYGLDVALAEPLPADSPLLRHENLVASPHMAWYSEEASRELKRKVAEEAVRFVGGREPAYRIC